MVRVKGLKMPICPNCKQCISHLRTDEVRTFKVTWKFKDSSHYNNQRTGLKKETVRVFRSSFYCPKCDESITTSSDRAGKILKEGQNNESSL